MTPVNLISLSKGGEFMYLSEIHRVYKGDSYFPMLDDFSFKAKNLYNNALFYVRQYYIYQRNLKEGKSVDNLIVPDEVLSYMKDKGSYINYNSLDYLAKQLNNSLTDDYKSLPLAAASQSVLKQLNINYLSFFKSLKSYNKNPSKYNGRPKMPKYLDKENGRFVFTLTNQNCQLKEGYIVFPKSFNGFTLKTKVDNLKQVRIVPKPNYYQIEIVYEVKEDLKAKDNSRYLSVDLGVTNLAAITNNFNGEQWLISGKPIKSVNQYYNKLKSDYQGLAKKLNNKHVTKRILKLTKKRNDRIDTYLHKASKLLVDLAVSYDVSKIVIGYNKNWKQEVNIGKRNNQNFVSIPFLTFVNDITYKAKLKGIEVILTEESYTSGTSFLDGELPIKSNYKKSRRIHRGLFKSNNGKLINSDVNGSYQILKKVIGNYYVTPMSLKVLQVT